MPAAGPGRTRRKEYLPMPSHPRRSRPAPRFPFALLRTSAVAALLFAATALPPAAASGAPPPSGDRVLVFSKTAEFRHDAIPDGIAAIRELGDRHGFAVDATEDAAAFTRANLA